jgi:hypothetical protein
MNKNESVESTLKAVTILDQYEDLGEQLEERFSGFLTGSNHAMFVEQKYGTLMMVEITPTNDPSVYLSASRTMELGVTNDCSKNGETVEAVAKTLNNMTAYEFLAKVLMNVDQEVDFEDMIVAIPAMANLKSGVA